MSERSTTSTVVGIDLATTADKTGVVVLQRERERWRASVPAIDRSDGSLTELVVGAAKLAVDSPLGWPITFIDAIRAHADGQDWDEACSSERFRYRTTDRAIRDRLKLNPLSVSTDRLGLTAMRCARLQTAWCERLGAPVDRAGAGTIVEVYPAATMKACDLPTKDYKKEPSVRATLLASIAAQTSGSLILDDVEAACVTSDHVFDGLVSAITGLLAQAGRTVTPGPLELEDARREGWIHAPEARCSLRELGPVR